MSLQNPEARFVLLRKGRKSTCPRCGKPKVFRRYVDTATGELLPDQCGYCDRADNCGYSLTAVQWLSMGGKVTEVPEMPPMPPPAPKITTYRMSETDAKHFADHTTNTLAEYLSRFFPRQSVLGVFDRYGVGTYTGKEERLKGATIFWMRDSNNEIRTGEIIVYKEGKRSHEKGDHTWAHYLKEKKSLSDLGGEECLFGEHLIRNWKARIGILESAKSAIICSLFQPDILFLSCRSLGGLTLAKCLPLVGRDVILYPDAGKGYAEWAEKAKIIEPAMERLVVFDLLEAMGFTDGEDVADLIVPDPLLRACEYELMPDEDDDNEELEDIEEEVPEPTQQHPPVIQRMIAKNPHIAGLIDVLDLDTSKLTIHA